MLGRGCPRFGRSGEGRAAHSAAVACSRSAPQALAPTRTLSAHGCLHGRMGQRRGQISPSLGRVGSHPTEAPTASSTLHTQDWQQQPLPNNNMPGPSGRTEADSETCWYFAYGANMNFFTLARRDVRVLSRDAALVRDPGIKLVFKHQGGYGTLERTDGPALNVPYDERVHGVLYKLSKTEFNKLRKREGGYAIQEIQVETYAGQVATALVFVSSPLFQLPQEVMPTESYITTLRDGARDNYLDPQYQAFLSGIRTVPSAGLGPEYYNTPSRFVAYLFLFIVGCITAAYFFQQ